MAIPVKVIAIEVTGLVLDVSAFVECESDNEDIIKVSFLETRALGERIRTSQGAEPQTGGELAFRAGHEVLKWSECGGRATGIPRSPGHV